ncbi:nitroreductase family protein [Photorhabdus sp. RM71S]|uniref:nitroreductase family protein n=1 Tax=Photorhabdus sp. RM71S TaxID=3342824 RepID=UPI0036DDD15E
MSVKNKIKSLLRPSYRFFKDRHNLITGSIYDFHRFLKYGGWKQNMYETSQRNYFSMLIYHGLEKSMSYKQRELGHGWRNAEILVTNLKIAQKTRDIDYHDKASKQILEKFISLPENINIARSKEIKAFLEQLDFTSDDEHGIKHLSLADFHKGRLENPEDFFFSRYTLREFRTKTVSDEKIEYAIKLATKTPSVCNRQHWHVYHTNDPKVRDLALELQNGNSHFGHKIPNLMIITTDLKAFYGPHERYQPWIDGGMFAMSLIYTFHSIGIASCVLNWSQLPKNDRLLRKRLNISPEHTIISYLAIGYPDKDNIVCSSKRKNYKSFIKKLESNNKK